MHTVSYACTGHILYINQHIHRYINKYIRHTHLHPLNSDPPITRVCASRKFRHQSGNRHHSARCHYGLFQSAPSDLTGAISGNRHYSTGTIEGPLLHELLQPFCGAGNDITAAVIGLPTSVYHDISPWTEIQGSFNINTNTPTVLTFTPGVVSCAT